MRIEEKFKLITECLKKNGKHDMKIIGFDLDKTHYQCANCPYDSWYMKGNKPQ
jgi:hypothetical protein